MELFDEDARRATFKYWFAGNKDACNKDKMAEAGFVFTGSSKERDAAQCFYCKKNLEGWEEDDDPWQEHIKHAPYCEFAQMKKPQSSWTLKEMQDFMVKTVNRNHETNVNKVKKFFESAREKVMEMK